MKIQKGLIIGMLLVFVRMGIVQAQTITDTTLHLILSPDPQLVEVKLKQDKIVKSCKIEGDVYIISCTNDPNVIKDVKKKVVSTAVANAAPQSDVVETVAPSPKLLITATGTTNNYNPKIDAFLNIEDETIFFDDYFEEIDTTSIHPRSYNYYCLINDIRQFEKKLKALKNLGYGRNQDEQAKTLLRQMDELYLRIRDYKELEYFSQIQKDYYLEIKNQYIDYDYIQR